MPEPVFAYLRVLEPSLLLAVLPAEPDAAPATTPPTRPIYDGTIVLEAPAYRIGRRVADCDIVIREQVDDISRKHATIRRTDGSGYMLVDHRSRNGTLVNSVRLQTDGDTEAMVGLKSGDSIGFGLHTKVFQFINPADLAAADLTASEHEILMLIARNPTFTNKEIAARFIRSENTIKTHLKRIYKKIGVETRHAAIEYARNVGLLDG